MSSENYNERGSIKSVLKDILIKDIIFNEEFEAFFDKQKTFANELHENIKMNGVLVPPIIDKHNVLIDGYERVRAYANNGNEKISVLQMETIASLDDRLDHNLQRVKTMKDLVREIKYKLKQIKKLQGRKKGGIKDSFLMKSIKILNGRWKTLDSINKFLHVIDNDFSNDILTESILTDSTSLESAYQYLKNIKEVAAENKFSINHRVERGEIQAHEAVKVVKDLLDFKKNYKGTFIIPEKGSTYNIDCRKIGEYSEYLGKVDLIITSIYYWIQKFYEIGEEVQPGNEATKEEYCMNIALMVLSWLQTLKESASVMINVGEVYRNGVPQKIPDLLIAAIEKVTGLVLYERIVWSKDNCRSGGNTENIRPRNSMEFILWFVLDPKKAKYKKLTYMKPGAKPQIMRGMGHEDAKGNKTKNVIKATSGYSSIWNHIKEQEIREIITTSVGNNHQILEFANTSHPAVMSALLPVCPILWTTDEGDLVFDPLSGTNVVGQISQMLNRRTLTTELSPIYYQDGCKNLQTGVHSFDPEALKIINQLAYGENNQDKYDNAA